MSGRPARAESPSRSAQANGRQLAPATLPLPPSAEGSPVEARLDRPLADTARSVQERRRIFPDPLFANPGWDMLLEIFIAWRQGRVLSVKAVCHASGVPKSTALRYLGQLCRRGMALKVPHESDKRTFNVSLARTGMEMMLRYLERV